MPPARTSRFSKNGRIALMCTVIFIAMTGAAFAAVPLYRVFCQATGFDGTISRAKTAPTTVLDKSVIVRFDANVRDIPWTFTPSQTSQTIKIGAQQLAFFKVTNNADHPVTGQASYNVVPEQAGAYFQKLQCFCFSEQTIPAHATVEFPVIYFVNPGYATDPGTKNRPEVTLSYTFFEVAAPKTKVAATAKPSPSLGEPPRAGL